MCTHYNFCQHTKDIPKNSQTDCYILLHLVQVAWTNSFFILGFFFLLFFRLCFDVLKIFWHFVGTTFKVLPDGLLMGRLKRSPCFMESKWSQALLELKVTLEKDRKRKRLRKKANVSGGLVVLLHILSLLSISGLSASTEQAFNHYLTFSIGRIISCDVLYPVREPKTQIRHVFPPKRLGDIPVVGDKAWEVNCFLRIILALIQQKHKLIHKHTFLPPVWDRGDVFHAVCTHII